MPSRWTSLAGVLALILLTEGRIAAADPIHIVFPQPSFSCQAPVFLYPDPAGGSIIVRFSQGRITNEYWGQNSFQVNERCAGRTNHHATISFSKPAKNIKFRLSTFETTEVNGQFFNPGYSDVTVPGPTTLVSVHGYSFYWSWEFILNSIQFEIAPPEESVDLHVEISNSQPANASASETLGPTHPVINVPLGARFRVWLTANGASANADYTLASAGAVQPQVTNCSVYPEAVAVSVGPTSAISAAWFQAVHLGQHALTIQRAGKPPKSATISVYAPPGLGKKKNEFDEDIVRWAHARGIAPQLLKAQIAQETIYSFDPDMYRYEPLTTDWNLVKSGDRFALPYREYILATPKADGGKAQGSKLARPDDTEPRNDLYVKRSGEPDFRPLAEDDEFVSAYEIFFANDGGPLSGTPLQVTKQNWHKKLKNSSKRAELDKDAPGALAFTAQTPLAASYGLLQVVFVTALAKNDFWSGCSGARNPHFLMDHPQWLSAGCSSIPAGTLMLVDHFLSSYSDKPVFSSFADVDAAWAKSLSKYNGWKGYGGEVFQKLNTYPETYFNLQLAKPLIE